MLPTVLNNKMTRLFDLASTGCVLIVSVATQLRIEAHAAELLFRMWKMIC